MINYNPKDWFTFIFRFHKADTFRELFPLIIGIAIYTGLIVYVEINYLKLSDNSHVKNIPIMHTLLGFAISMLLVFRTNTAYDRWWEGRKLWGAFVNNSRNLALKMAAMLPEKDKENRLFFKKTIPAFAYALHTHLLAEKTRIELFDHADSPTALKQIDSSKHVPNQIAAVIFNHVNLLYQQQKITGNQFIIINAELQSFTDISGACERIKNTPIPFSYSIFLKKFIFFYVMSLPFGFAFNLGYIAIPVVAFIFYVLTSLELIAEEIEDPFGGDANDVPTKKIAENIHRNVTELL
jgi:ion channel-forming bestrophin family protein